MSKLETGIDNMTRKEVIWQLKGLLLGELRTTTKERKALEYAISSLETDEAYQLEYERPEFCKDCISREQALRELKESAEHHANDSREEVLLRRDRDIIKALPSVTPQEPRKGHWTEEFNDLEGEVRFTCSSCGKYQLFGTDFCYHCGSDNREVVEE